jgi:hypothetical protein
MSYPDICLEVQINTTNVSTRIVGTPPEIRNKNLPNIRLQHYRYANIFIRIKLSEHLAQEYMGMTKSRRMRWEGHVARMGNTRNA